MQDPVGRIHPGPLPRPVCLLSQVPALPASGPSPDQGQQCLLDRPDLHHCQSQVPKKCPCRLICVHGRTLTPSSAHSVALRPDSPSSGDAKPRTTLLATAPMVFSTDQCRDPDHRPRPAHRDSLSSGPLPAPSQTGPHLAGPAGSSPRPPSFTPRGPCLPARARGPRRADTRD